MPAITGGAELIRKLRETGTGVGKLNIGRAVLADNPAATAADVIAAFEAAIVDDQQTKNHPRVSELTLMKARALAETGQWTPPKSAYDVPIEDLILGVPAETKPNLVFPPPASTGGAVVSGPTVEQTSGLPVGEVIPGGELIHGDPAKNLPADVGKLGPIGPNDPKVIGVSDPKKPAPKGK